MAATISFSPAEPKADEDTLTITLAGFSTTTKYLVAIGITGTLAAALATDYQTLIESDAIVKPVTTDGSGAGTVTVVLNNAGLYTVNVYPTPTMTNAATGTQTFTAISSG